MYYDYIIVGAGISGLYALYNLLKLYPNKKVLIIEKHKFGGRVGTINFQGHTVTTGAGVGRQKDKLLIKFLKELDIPVQNFELKLTTPYKNTLPQILEKFKKHKPFLFETFEEYGLRVLGKEQLHRFVVNSGYTDYLRANAIETLENYGFEDVLPGFKGFYIPWKILLTKLRELKGNWEYKKEDVIGFGSESKLLYNIQTSKNNYNCSFVIFAIPPYNLSKIVPGLYNPKISSQPFSRTYIKTNKPLGIPENGVFNCIGLIQKIIPIGDNIYMLYNDNKEAIWIKNADITEIKGELYKEMLYYKGVKTKIQIMKIKKIYWERGTHYYNIYPNDINLYPYDRVAIVGEAYSFNQGWVEGALETVNKVINKIKKV
jgi:hypothetical protein